MNSLLIFYALFVLILVGVGVLVIYNFIRYRFKDDKTLLFIGLFSLLFVLDIILTLSLFSAVSASTIGL